MQLVKESDRKLKVNTICFDLMVLFLTLFWIVMLDAKNILKQKLK